MPGYPRGGTGIDGQGLARDVPGFQSRLLALPLVGICRDGNVLGLVYVHPATIHSRAGLVGDGGFAICHGKGSKAEKENKPK